ncbi:MAG: choice-of-anchor J domain-containing protein, partial [Gallicola sp.]|nr:choice-of-anchor J domain-containing protein [Gallicola sp.]
DFPPHGWTSYDLDGDGIKWTLSAEGEGHNQTSGASSHSWFMQDLKPKNLLVSPQVKVSDSDKTLKFWMTSFESRPEKLNILVSTTNSEPTSFTVIDSLVYPANTPAGVTKEYDLSKYVGKNIYVGFEHHADTSLLVLTLDNIELPERVPLLKDLTITKILTPHDAPCDMSDTKMKVRIKNFGVESVTKFSIACIFAHMVDQDATPTFSEYISDYNIEQVIAPGDSIDYEFSKPLLYGNHASGIFTSRAFLIKESYGDQYCYNDTIQNTIVKFSSNPSPYYSSFEGHSRVESKTLNQLSLSDLFVRNLRNDIAGWSIISSTQPPSWGIYSNSEIRVAKTGDGFVGMMARSTGQTGKKDLLSSCCLHLEAGKKYRFSINYNIDCHRPINLKMSLGKDAHNLDSYSLVVC